MDTLQSFFPRLHNDLPAILDELAGVYAAVPFDVLLIGHSLCVAAMFRKLRDRYLLSYWVICGCTHSQTHCRHPPHPPTIGFICSGICRWRHQRIAHL